MKLKQYTWLASARASSHGLRAYELTSLQAQAILSLILLVGGIIVIIALGLAFLTTSFVNSSYGYAIAERAQAAASAGAQDALMQLARNKDFGGTSGTTYSLAVGGATASVTVLEGNGSNGYASGQTSITSQATVVLRQRTIHAVVSVDANTGQVSVISWTQT